MTRTAALAGAVSMVFALLLAYLLSVVGIPFAPAALGQALIEVLPGWISVPLIELLEHWAQRLLIAGVLVAFLISGTAAGALIGRPRGALLAVAFGGGPWLAAVVLGQLFAGQLLDPAATLFDASVGALAFFGALFYLTSSEKVMDPASAAGRRRVLVGGASAAALLTLLSLGLGSALRAVRPAAELIRLTPARLLSRASVPAGQPEFERIARLTPRLTPAGRHYVVDTALIDPRVEVAGWRLDVGGAVEEPYSITYDELLAMDAVERVHTLECISNDIGGDLVSTAIWTGARMGDLLERARPLPSGYDVVLTSVDGYTDSIRLAKAMQPETLVAYLMEGHTLPEAHGYPVRALIPDIYGMKNVKWLRRIDVATHDFQGYWMERGWSDVAVYNVHTWIDTPRGSRAWDGGPIQIAGIAFAGARGISRVEVSTDQGNNWTDAELEIPVGDHTWRRWRYEWTPSADGRHLLVARSTDGEGQIETPIPRPPFPSGSTGYATSEVQLSGA